MNYKELELQGRTPSALTTEIMYEIASARVAGVSLLRFNISRGEDEKLFKRLTSAQKRTLRSMKERGSIQFFALPDNFASFATEAKFLVNKFPELFESLPEQGEDSTFAYVKI